MLFYIQGNVVVTYTTEKPIRAVPPFYFLLTMKKIYLKTLLLCILSFVSITSSAYSCNVDGVYYNLDYTNRTASVTYKSYSFANGYNKDYTPTTITIPSSITVGSVNYAVTSIGKGAFYDCRSLTSVTIPNSVTSIGEDAFWGCSSLTSVTIPNSVTSIGEAAFGLCLGLTSVTIPNSVTSIDRNAFRGCSGLTSVTIPNSVTSISNFAFFACSGLTSVTIPNSVTSIGTCAFDACWSLTSVTIPNSVTSIGESAFQYCRNLTSVTIPNSVTEIGEKAFSGCTNLEQITVESGNRYYDSRENCNAIIETKNNALIAGCKNTNIPNSVTSIGWYAFYGCNDLTSVTIPNSVTSIGKQAFCSCGLTSVTIPNSVTEIGYGAFQDCSYLTSVTIPNSVTSIGIYAFYGCSELTSVISLIQEPEDISIYEFMGSYYNATLYVPEGTAYKYRAKEGWKEFKNIVEGDPTSIALPDNYTSDATETERYDINGKRIATPHRGINVVKMSDGTVKKVLVK